MEPTTDFEEFAELFRAFGENTRDIYAPWLEEHMPGGTRAVDLGCGCWRFTRMLGERYHEVLAVDVAAKLVANAREQNSHPRVDYRCCSLLEVTSERDWRFDLVLAVNVLHHAGPHHEVLRTSRA